MHTVDLALLSNRPKVSDQMIEANIFTNVHNVSVYCNDSRSGSRTVFMLPLHLGNIQGGFEMLNEIEADYLRDLEINRSRLRAHEYSEELSAFVRRENWRISSYVIYACSMEKILSDSFKFTRDYLRLPHTADSDNDAVENLARELKTYRRYRNKVFAHPAGAYPKDDDNFSMRATSLMIFGAQSAMFSDKGIGVGGVAATTEGVEAAKFDPIFFADLAQAMSSHYDRWISMFAKLLKLAASTDENTLKLCDPRIEIMHWRQPSRPIV